MKVRDVTVKFVIIDDDEDGSISGVLMDQLFDFAWAPAHLDPAPLDVKKISDVLRSPNRNEKKELTELGYEFEQEEDEG